MTRDKCCRNIKSKLIYSFSESDNIGKMADQISKKFTKEEYGNMTCLASMRKETN